jgi:hypothetical protein
MSTANPAQARKFTVQTDQPFVVFLVGMRINRLRSFKKWRLVTSYFPRMISALEEHPETGFLGKEQFFRLFPITTLALTYWRTMDDLERFATGRGSIHVKGWQDFNKQIGTDGSVGVWHETYVMEPGKHESLYVNMPLFGMSKAVPGVTDAVGNLHSQHGRMHAPAQPVYAEPVR